MPQAAPPLPPLQRRVGSKHATVPAQGWAGLVAFPMAWHDPGAASSPVRLSHHPGCQQ